MINPLLARFIPEARDLIASSTSGLLKLEKAPADAEAVNEVFRAVHTLKGSSGLFDVPALTRLVHVAEDLLGAIRAEKLALDADLVDKLLQSLDQVGIWIDHMEMTEMLPADADGVSKALSQGLVVEDRAADRSAPAAAPAVERPPVAAWLAGLRHEDRLGAFRRIMAGEALAAACYRPAPDCFFNGTDPLALMLHAPGLVRLAAEPVEPFPALADLDPYRCNLRFTLIATATVGDLEQHLRYELDHVAIGEVAAADLVVLSGAPSTAPVWEDFHEAATDLLARGDLGGLGDRIAALRGMTGDDLAPVAALAFMEAALAAPGPDRALLAALIDATVSGRFTAPSMDAAGPVGAAPDLAAPASAARAARDVELGLDILATQRRGLDGHPFDAGRLGLAAGAVEKLASALDRSDLGGAIDAAVEASHAAGSTAPFLALLDRIGSELFPAEASRAGPAGAASSAPPAAEPDRSGTAPPPSSRPPDHAGSDARGLPKTVKVDQGKIDHLMNLIGELVVSKNGLPFLAKRAEETHGSREMSREIKDQYAVIDRLAQEMQSTIMQVRMLPFSDVFDRFPRLVRDLARKLAKDIDLVIEGGDTEADKTIIEALGDPLLHIVRNSLDHGVELPDRRVAAGKPARATITLKAYQEADYVVIEVVDDGAGMDPARIRASAVAKGVIDQDEADRLTDQESINLIFRPGFSTAAQISDLSGRGVGMDVVRTAVEKLGGRVTVQSSIGVGSRTRLEVPLSMAVTRVMIVEAAGGVYGVPMDLIVETVRIETDRIHAIKQAEAFVLRDRLIPLVRMDRLLRAEACPRGDGTEAVLVCRMDGRDVGLVIDDFRVGMDVVLKPLEGIVAGLRGFSGTTLLGDGRVLLVLNLKELM
jgi:two-component system chemotaxis sensor kinase CheA